MVVSIISALQSNINLYTRSDLVNFGISVSPPKKKVPNNSRNVRKKPMNVKKQVRIKNFHFTEI